MSCPKYVNPIKKLETFFLSFDSGARLEIMQKPDLDGYYEAVAVDPDGARRTFAKVAFGSAHINSPAGGQGMNSGIQIKPPAT